MRRLTAWIGRIAAFLLALPPFGLAQAVPGPMELIQQVLDAAERRDAERLKALAGTEAEFRDYVWPYLIETHQVAPGTDPRRYFAEYRQNSDNAVDELLREYGGRNVKILRVATLVATLALVSDSAKSLEVRDGPNVFIRDEDGNERLVRLAGGIVRREAVWKATTFYLHPQ